MTEKPQRDKEGDFMNKNGKQEQFDEKHLTDATKVVEAAFADIYCWQKEPCGNYALCDRTGTCYLRLGDER